MIYMTFYVVFLPQERPAERPDLGASIGDARAQDECLELRGEVVWSCVEVL